MANDVQFNWTREPGTFRFTGSFDKGRGAGTYQFTPDQTFITNMASAGYRNLASDELVRTRIHRVTPEFIRDLASLGFGLATISLSSNVNGGRITAFSGVSGSNANATMDISGTTRAGRVRLEDSSGGTVGELP